MGDLADDSLLAADLSAAEAWTLHQGDAKQTRHLLGEYIAADAPRSVVQSVITSPPYADLVDYDSGTDEIGQATSYNDYLEDLRTVFKNAYDVTRDDGTMWVVVDEFMDDGRVVPLPWDIVRVCENLQARRTCSDCDGGLQQEGRSGTLECVDCGTPAPNLDESWRLRDVIIWRKDKARPWRSEGSLRNGFEYILSFGKTPDASVDVDAIRVADPAELSEWWLDWPERYHPRGVVPENVWEIGGHTRGSWGTSVNDHPAAFPAELVARLLRFSTTPGDVVLDPFAGTGSVIAQATAMDRRGFGIELNQEFVDAYPNVRDELVTAWEQTVSEDKDLLAQQRQLAKTIWTLRQLVYAKKLVLHLRQTFEADSVAELGVHSVFVVSPDPDQEWLATETARTEFTIVCDGVEESTREAIAAAVSEAQSMSPWDGFDISATTQIVSVDDLADDGGDAWPLAADAAYLYPKGQHWWFSRRLSRSEWCRQSTPAQSWWSEFASNAYPPLLSNLPVHVDRDRSDGAHSIEHEATLLDAPPAAAAGEEGESSVRIETGLLRTRLTDF